MTIKISKNTSKSVKASSNVNSNKNDAAVQYIRSAMEVLNESAKTDIVAKEAIENLAVIMFDLR